MNEVARDPHRLLAGLHRDGVSLELANLDVCFSPLCIFAPSRTACQLSMTALARSCGTHDPRGESR